MCGRYVIVQKIEVLEKRFNATAVEGLLFGPDANIGIGKVAPVITDAAPRELQGFTFGFTPFWAKKPMYLFNARAEGDRNAGNDPNYTGALDIIGKPAFRRSIRSRRCLIPFDAFIEGTVQEKLSRPFLVHITDSRPPHAFAGIWDEWMDPNTGAVLRSFAIITTTANATLQLLPHHRSPVILPREHESAWLDPTLPLQDVLSLLTPYPAESMNAWPIDPAVKHPAAQGVELLRPIGAPVRQETEVVFSVDLLLQGMSRR